MIYVTDTNVWYDIAVGKIELQHLIKRDDKLYATAINVIEIATSSKTFLRKKTIFKEILKYSDDILPVPIIYLAFLFNYDVDTSSDYWRSMINEYILNSVITPKITDDLLVLQSINDSYHTYCKTIEGFHNKVIPGHSFIEHKAQEIKGKKRELFIEFYNSKDYKTTFYNYLHQSLREILSQNNINKTNMTKKEIYPLLEPYIKIHKEYELMCGINFKAKSNDYADLQHFLYIQNGRKLVTSDKRWIKLSQKAGLSNFVIDPHA